ncbi:MAG: LuxR C-terminal-related transcriptional regulator [Micropruina sp.]
MPVLGVRFRLPPPRRASIGRERLTALLDNDGFMPRLILIAAPAGFGKTTLLTQWLVSVTARSPAPTVAWLAVEASDQDIGSFLTDIVAALNHAIGGGLPHTRGLLSAERMPAIEDAVASLVNELDEHPDPVILALDDFHLADSPEVHRALTFLIENLPPRVTVAMTTRADPAMPLPRLRARGELVEIRAADLTFTTDEATAFLGDLTGLTLTTAQAAALAARTEGWAAGLQLAGLSARGHQDNLDEFIDDFSGSHRFVLDYLIEEVLEGEDHDTRDFLHTTSVLERLDRGLCDAVTGRTDSQQTLRRLEARNLFVVALDEGRGWYRYHPLFAGALRARLATNRPGSVPALHAVAATEYAARGMLGEAIGHAAQTGDPVLLADLVEAELPELRKHRRDQAIIDRLVLLDQAELIGRPLLATFRGWAGMAAGHLDEVEPWLRTAGAGFTARPAPLCVRVPDEIEQLRAEETRLVPSTIALYRAALAQAHGDPAATVHHAERARELAGPADHLVHAAAAGFLGLTAWVRGDLHAGRALFEDTRRRLEAAGNTADALATTVPMAEMTMALGELAAAWSMYADAVATADAHTGVPLACQADLHVGRATVLRERGDLDAATRELQAARELDDSASLPENRFRWFAAASELRRSAGDLLGALDLIDRAHELYLPGFFPDVRPLPARRAQLLIDLGRLGEARDWATEQGVDRSAEPTYRNEYEQLTYARLLLAEGQAGEAATIVDALTELAEAEDRAGNLIELLVVGALARRAAGSRHRAQRRLSRAVILGVPAGYRRVFLDHGEPLRRLLRSGFDDPAANSAARSLLDEHSVSGAAPVIPLQLAAEPLSEREREVLRFLRTDLSGPEIARALSISLNTFRTHTKRIFLKLDVKTRRAAVSRAAGLSID